MPPSDKEVRHLRLVDAGTTTPLAQPSSHEQHFGGPVLVDAALLTHTIAAQRRGARRALLWPLLGAAGGVAIVGMAMLALVGQPQVPADSFLHLPPAVHGAPLSGPSIRLVAHEVAPHATEWSLSLHNLPGVEREAAAEIAVAVVGPRGEVAWLAPAAHPEGSPWPIPHVATMELPDGPLLSAAPVGTRVVAMFLRAGARSEDILAWARAGAAHDSRTLSARLVPHVVHVQTLYF